MLEWLRSKGETTAADWYVKKLDGGWWMLADMIWHGWQQQWTGRRSQVSSRCNWWQKKCALPFMFTQYSKYMTDYSERLEANAIERGIDRVSFQKVPRAECIHWDILQLLDLCTMFLCCIPQGFSKNWLERCVPIFIRGTTCTRPSANARYET